MTFKVLITCPPMLRHIDKFKKKFDSLGIIPSAPKVIQTLTEEELVELVPKHHGWIIGDDPATSRVFLSGKSGKLKAAVKWGIGTDNVDFDICKKNNIPISNTPGIFGEEVADLAICYLLGLAKEVFYIDREVRKGNWPKPTGISLRKKTLGIIGLGDIGKNIAKRANALNLNIIGWDPFPKDLEDYIDFQSNWPSKIENCDFLIFACALTKENHHIFSEKILDKIKTSLRIINISRGPLIDEKALIKGLESGKIHSAALDVYEEEPLRKNHQILNHSRCILGSHNASNTIEAVMRASNQAIDILHKSLTKMDT